MFMNQFLFALAAVFLSFVAVGQSMQAGMPPLPPNAKPGECYTRVYTPPVFKTQTETVLKTAASERLEIVPAEYEWVEEKILVKAESERVTQVIPAEYRWVEERVMVKPASERYEQLPATYKIQEERQLVKPATTMWKAGKGLIQKVDNVTGDIMCLVEVPAEYKTLMTKVVDQEASVRRIPVPAEYTTINRQELVRPAEVRKEVAPAEYKLVKVRREVRPAEERSIPVPASYQEITRQVLVRDGTLEWSTVLCETNATPAVAKKLQLALRAAGYDPGPIDGDWGSETLSAVRAYQQARGLATGGVTVETLDSLGVGVSGN